MSYTILYRKLFITLPSGRLIPMIQSGSNNLYNTDPRTGREARVREWSAWTLNTGRPSVKTDDIAAFIDAEAKAALDRCEGPHDFNPVANFGWFRSLAIGGRSTTGTTLGSFRAFLTGGIRDAIRLEDFIRTCGPLKVQWWHKNPGEQFGSCRSSEYISTEADLERVWDKVKNTEGFDGGPWLVPASSWRLDGTADLVAAQNPRAGSKATKLRVRLEDGTSGYVKTLFPLSVCPDEDDALRISLSGLDSAHIHDVIPGLKEASYKRT